MDVLILIIQMLLVGLSVAIDAFAVATTNGMCYVDIDKKKGVAISATFGGFQMLMPALGAMAGAVLANIANSCFHWISLILLAIIGGKMLVDGIKQGNAAPDDEVIVKRFNYKEVLLQGVATSIDAFAIGITLVGATTLLMPITYVVISIAVMGVLTFALSFVGVLLGIKIGKMLSDKVFIAQIIGGLVLILLGVKIVLSHYGVLPF